MKKKKPNKKKFKNALRLIRMTRATLLTGQSTRSSWWLHFFSFLLRSCSTPETWQWVRWKMKMCRPHYFVEIWPRPQMTNTSSTVSLQQKSNSHVKWLREFSIAWNCYVYETGKKNRHQNSVELYTWSKHTPSQMGINDQHGRAHSATATGEKTKHSLAKFRAAST